MNKQNVGSAIKPYVHMMEVNQHRAAWPALISGVKHSHPLNPVKKLRSTAEPGSRNSYLRILAADRDQTFSSNANLDSRLNNVHTGRGSKQIQFQHSKNTSLLNDGSATQVHSKSSPKQVVVKPDDSNVSRKQVQKTHKQLMEYIERRNKRSKMDIEIYDAVDGIDYAQGNFRNVKTPNEGSGGMAQNHNSFRQRDNQILQVDSKRLSFMDKAQLAASAYAKIDLLRDIEKSSKLTAQESLVSPEQEAPDSFDEKVNLNAIVIEAKQRMTYACGFDLQRHSQGHKTQQRFFSRGHAHLSQTHQNLNKIRMSQIVSSNIIEKSIQRDRYFSPCHFQVGGKKYEPIMQLQKEKSAKSKATYLKNKRESIQDRYQQMVKEFNNITQGSQVIDPMPSHSNSEVKEGRYLMKETNNSISPMQGITKPVNFRQNSNDFLGQSPKKQQLESNNSSIPQLIITSREKDKDSSPPKQWKEGSHTTKSINQNSNLEYGAPVSLPDQPFSSTVRETHNEKSSGNMLIDESTPAQFKLEGRILIQNQKQSRLNKLQQLSSTMNNNTETKSRPINRNIVHITSQKSQNSPTKIKPEIEDKEQEIRNSLQDFERREQESTMARKDTHQDVFKLHTQTDIDNASKEIGKGITNKLQLIKQFSITDINKKQMSSSKSIATPNSRKEFNVDSSQEMALSGFHMTNKRSTKHPSEVNPTMQAASPSFKNIPNQNIDLRVVRINRSPINISNQGLQVKSAKRSLIRKQVGGSQEPIQRKQENDYIQVARKPKGYCTKQSNYVQNKKKAQKVHDTNAMIYFEKGMSTFQRKNYRGTQMFYTGRAVTPALQRSIMQQFERIDRQTDDLLNSASKLNQDLDLACKQAIRYEDGLMTNDQSRMDSDLKKNLTNQTSVHTKENGIPLKDPNHSSAQERRIRESTKSVLSDQNNVNTSQQESQLPARFDQIKRRSQLGTFSIPSDDEFQQILTSNQQKLFLSKVKNDVEYQRMLMNNNQVKEQTFGNYSSFGTMEGILTGVIQIRGPTANTLHTKSEIETQQFLQGENNQPQLESSQKRKKSKSKEEQGSKVTNTIQSPCKLNRKRREEEDSYEFSHKKSSVNLFARSNSCDIKLTNEQGDVDLRQFYRHMFEERQQEWIKRKESRLCAKGKTHFFQKVPQNLMKTPIQSIGKISEIQKRQEIVLDTKFATQRNLLLNFNLTLKNQDLFEKLLDQTTLAKKKLRQSKQHTNKKATSISSDDDKHRKPPKQYENNELPISQKLLQKIDAHYRQTVTSPGYQRGEFTSQSLDNINGKLRFQPKYAITPEDDFVYGRLNPVAIHDGLKEKHHPNYLIDKKHMWDGVKEERVSEMTEFQKETYELIFKLKQRNTVEAIQATLLQYMKTNKHEEMFSEFSNEIQQAIKSRQEVKAQAVIKETAKQPSPPTRKFFPIHQRKVSQSEMESEDSGSLSENAQQALNLTQFESTAVERANKKQKENKELYDNYIKSKKAAEKKLRQEEEAEKKMVHSWTRQQLPGTTFHITTEQRNNIIEKVQSQQLPPKVFQQKLKQWRAEGQQKLAEKYQVPNQELIEKEEAKQRLIESVNRVRQRNKNRINIHYFSTSSQSILPTSQNELEDVNGISSSILQNYPSVFIMSKQEIFNVAVTPDEVIRIHTEPGAIKTNTSAAVQDTQTPSVRPTKEELKLKKEKNSENCQIKREKERQQKELEIKQAAINFKRQCSEMLLQHAMAMQNNSVINQKMKRNLVLQHSQLAETQEQNLKLLQNKKASVIRESSLWNLRPIKNEESSMIEVMAKQNKQCQREQIRKKMKSQQSQETIFARHKRQLTSVAKNCQDVVGRLFKEEKLQNKYAALSEAEMEQIDNQAQEMVDVLETMLEKLKLQSKDGSCENILIKNILKEMKLHGDGQKQLIQEVKSEYKTYSQVHIRKFLKDLLREAINEVNQPNYKMPDSDASEDEQPEEQQPAKKLIVSIKSQ